MKNMRGGNTLDITDLIGEATEYDKKEMLEEKKPKSWCKSVSAFANGSGGTLIFGIANDDRIVGLADAEHDAEKISELIKTKMDPIPNFKLHFYQTEDGKKLILLDIYAGDETPYYYDGDGTKTAFHRVGNESVPVDRIKLKELVLKGAGKSYDSLPSTYKFENMAFTKLKSTYNQRTGNTFEDVDYESFGIVDETGRLTNAGALLADESPVRQSRLFCTRWNGLDKAPGIIDAVDDKEFSGGLINLLQDGTEFVTNNSKKAWMKVADGRVEMPDYPKRAVMEGLVNALIHRNYLEVGSEVHIDMFDDRLEIYSPGGMYDGSKVQDCDIMNIPSRRRNPVIADIFNRLKLMDRRGSGFKKILGEYRKQSKYDESFIPKFVSDNNSFFLVLKNLNYVTQTTQSTTQSTTQLTTQSKRITEKDKAILACIKNNPQISNAEMALELNWPVDRVKYYTKKLKKIGVIQRQGSSKQGRWVIDEMLN